MTVLVSFRDLLDKPSPKSPGKAPKRSQSIIKASARPKRQPRKKPRSALARSDRRPKRSWIEKFALLPQSKQDKLLRSLSEDEVQCIMHAWDLWRRPDQTLPKVYDIAVCEAGRGFGKTRIGAEEVRKWVNEGARHIAIVARDAASYRDTMIYGESGLINVFPEHQRPIYYPSKRQVLFHTDAIGYCYSDAEPDQLAGRQHEKAWVDEGALFKNLDKTFYMLMFGLRIGDNPQVVLTTTPRRTKAYRSIFHSKSSKYLKEWKVRFINGSSYSNMSNLSPKFINTIVRAYEGTSIGRQELYGLFQEDAGGALWTSEMLANANDVADIRLDRMQEICVAVDPSVTFTEDSAECGIVICGKGYDGEGYVLGDWSCRVPAVSKVIDGIEIPGWAEKVAEAYFFFDADVVVGEVNNGGDLVEAAIQHVNEKWGNPADINFKAVRATRGKRTRAEPVAMLYEKGLIHHVGCADLEKLEEQLMSWEPGEKSPDRLDAEVWGLTHLFLGSGREFEVLANPRKWQRILHGGLNERLLAA